MAFCRNCGEEIPSGAKFCTNCGAPVDLPESKPEPEPAENPQLTAELSPERLYGNGESGFSQEAAAARGRKGGRAGKSVPVLGILALVLAVIGLLGSAAVPPIASVAALVLAILSLVKKERRKGLAIAALVIAALSLLVAAGESGGGRSGNDSAAVWEESDALETSAADSNAAEEGEEEKEEEVQEFSLGGVTFRIPVKYEADDLSFTAADGCTGFIFQNIDGMTDEQFEKAADKLDQKMDEMMADSLTSPVRKSALGSEVAGQKARSYCYTGEMEDSQVTAYVDLINVEEKGKLLMVMGVAEESRTEEFEADYRKVIDSAVYTNAADTKRPESAADSADDEAKDASAAPAGVDPDLKTFLDGYEAFMDKYIDFMQKYEANPTDLGFLMEYADMMQEYADFVEKVDAYDSDEMSAADAAYYLEVTSRCTQKMLRLLGSTE